MGAQSEIGAALASEPNGNAQKCDTHAYSNICWVRREAAEGPDVASRTYVHAWTEEQANMNI